MTLDGDGRKTGKTWVATVTLGGPVGASTSGVWSLGQSGSCTIPSGSTSCTFSVNKISADTASVTYTDPAFGPLEITMPAKSTGKAKR